MCACYLQVEGVASMVKENLDINKPGIKCCFLNQNPSGKTVLNILNPDTAQGGRGITLHHNVIKVMWVCHTVYSIYM